MDFKILILAYYFPPSNSTASDRTFYWYKFLKEKKYPVRVICKNWGDFKLSNQSNDIEQIDLKVSKIKQIGNLPLIHKIYKQFSPNLEPQFLLQGEVGLLNAAEKYISENKNVILITSSSPYSLFNVGYMLKKKFPNLKWIADYRDEWSSRELVNYRIPFLADYFINWTANLEKKWVSEADAFVSVSERFMKGINGVLNHKVPGFLIENGYDFLKNSNQNIKSDEIHFAYTGNVYKVQDFEANLNKINQSAQKYKSVKTIVSFVGANIEKIRRENLINQNPNLELRFLNYMQRAELDEFCKNVDVFLLVAYGDIKGIPSSKIYYFISFRKPIFLYPSDHDIIDEIVTDCGLKVTSLSNLYDQIISRKSIDILEIDPQKIYKYSREAGTEKLINLIQLLGKGDLNNESIN